MRGRAGRVASHSALFALLDDMCSGDWAPDPELFVRPPSSNEVSDRIGRTEELCDEAAIADHAFFALCRKDERALKIWAAQEFWISGVFSQILALWLSTI